MENTKRTPHHHTHLAQRTVERNVGRSAHADRHIDELTRCEHDATFPNSRRSSCRRRQLAPAGHSVSGRWLPGSTTSRWSRIASEQQSCCYTQVREDDDEWWRT